MKKPYGYLTTGEFANICRVKKQTLFHYDQIGILSPEILGDNGYRYYSYMQLDTFNAISMLKDLDMPLADIKKYLDSRSPSGFLALLEEQSRLVDEKIEELEWLKKFIDRRIVTTKEGINAEHGKIFFETRPEEALVITEYHGGTADPDIYAGLALHFANDWDNQIYSFYAIGGIIDTNDAPWNDSYRYSYFFTRVEPEYAALTAGSQLRTARSCICTYSTQGFDYVPDLLNKLTEYAASHNFKTESYVIEEMLLDDMSNFDFDTYTLKLSLPIIDE